MTKVFLLDTHTFLWMVSDDVRLKAAEKHIMNAEQLYLSMASWWEIAIKINIGKSSYDYAELLTIAKKMHLDFLPITPQHGQTLLTLPFIHRDPFDRMLVAQAISEQIPLLTHDQTLTSYSSFVILF
ncbi:MAG: type II toxin-antitoxin system VapC family toxin [Moraxellaceae bacterium]|nr:type II toxin-antitoxin system VapC family toxin [Pseudomonadales bacterium]MCP5175127.1 type II toxin-antitoxin system VapC family toxin [Moraxellaceae bacterium]MCP5176061.1 type II toxin-antitoxin system VapC family toxin [Moraxellaceae bacterium]HQV22218.1 type II toxin-antitoxin system VapC family toxin [Agitococcus sp.]